MSYKAEDEESKRTRGVSKREEYNKRKREVGNK
jgi:hypothetical protein